MDQDIRRCGRWAWILLPSFGVQNNTAFFKLTIPTRVFVFISFVSFVLLGYTAPIIAGIGAVDLLGAAWTYFALKK